MAEANYEHELGLSTLPKTSTGSFAKYHYQYPNLKDEENTLIARYKKTFELVTRVKETCELEVSADDQLTG